MGNSTSVDEEELTELKENNVLCFSSTKHEAITQGCMLKQPISTTRVISPGRWKERFFILKRGGIFYYSITLVQTYDMSLVVDVELGELQFTLPGESGHKIILQFANGDLLTFAVPLKDHARDWVNALREKARETKAIVPNLSGLNEDYKQGTVYYLAYPNTHWETWCLRHLSLEENGHLIVRETSQLGHFSLSGSQVEHNPDPQTFHVVSSTAGPKILTLRCDSPLLCERWKMSIAQHLQQQPAHHVSSQGVMLEFYNTLHDVMENGEGRRRRKETAPKPSERALFLILSIDGGGTRGIMPCIILERILEKFPDFLSRVDMLAGTSNGALLAMALAFGHHPHTIREMMLLTSRAVFSEQQGRYSVSSAKWSNRFLALFCQEVWQDTTMADAHVPCLVPAFLLDNEKETGRDMEMRLFTSSTNNGGGEKVRDVLMRTCAAPIYFPAWQSHVDGGVFAHNPADLAIAHALTHLKIPLEKVAVLSLSTGHVKQFMPPTESGGGHNYGYYQWAVKLPTVLWRGMIDKSTAICQALVGDRFFRIDPELPEELALDQPEVFPTMITCAEKENLDDTFAWIQEKFY